jgi:hypothetical protein
MVPNPTDEWQMPFIHWKMRGRYESMPLLVLSEEIIFLNSSEGRINFIKRRKFNVHN